MNMRLDCGAAAMVDGVIWKGIMYGQKDSARVPNADTKIIPTI